LFLVLSGRWPTRTVFPYTTLFRSQVRGRLRIGWVPSLDELRSGTETMRQSPCRSQRLTPPNMRAAGTSDSTWDAAVVRRAATASDRKSTRLNSSHVAISYAVFCLK